MSLFHREFGQKLHCFVIKFWPLGDPLVGSEHISETTFSNRTSPHWQTDRKNFRHWRFKWGIVVNSCEIQLKAGVRERDELNVILGPNIWSDLSDRSPLGLL